MKHLARSVVLIASLLLLAGASAEDVAKPLPKPELTPDMLRAAEDGNRFALDLYARVRAEPGNVFVSPYSVSTALAMTYLGARAETAAQMAKTLHFTQDPKRLHAALRDLMRWHRGSAQAGYQLNVANALWGQKDFGFLPDFLAATKAHYGAGLQEVDFRRMTDRARQTINAWVDEQTQGKIKDLLQPGDLTPDSRLVLTNAIYFKSSWMNGFEKSATYAEPFHLSAAQKVKVPMMHRQAHFGYLDGSTFQALVLPYQRNALSMVVLMPKQVDGLSDLEKTLSADKVKGLLSKVSYPDVVVTLPKFKVTQRLKLAETLKGMGMPLPFDPSKADFSGISGSSDRLFIGNVIHKAFVEVHEGGTEAAAATAVEIAKEAADKGSRPAPPVFRADRPFVFLIRDNQTGSILFIGRLTDPRS
jgi:serpin B